MSNETQKVILNIDGKATECDVTVDANSEFLCTVPELEVIEGKPEPDNSRAGRFVKFPEGADLAQEVKEYNERHPVTA